MVTPLRSAARFMTKIAASAAMIAMMASAPQPRQSAAVPSSTGNSVGVPQFGVAESDYRPIVRLRKLHLVRPDLIPYPVYYAVYC